MMHIGPQEQLGLFHVHGHGPLRGHGGVASVTLCVAGVELSMRRGHG